MSAAQTLHLVPVETYLAGESDSAPWYEYVDGFVFRRPDERNAHNKVSGNVFGSLAFRLRRKRFQAWTSATRVRAESNSRVRFYHPDGSVIARDSYHDEPAVVV